MQRPHFHQVVRTGWKCGLCTRVARTEHVCSVPPTTSPAVAQPLSLSAAPAVPQPLSDRPQSLARSILLRSYCDQACRGRGCFGETLPGWFNPFIPPAFAMAEEEGPDSRSPSVDSSQQPDEVASQPGEDDEHRATRTPPSRTKTTKTKFFYYRTCPCSSNCSSMSWKKADVWGWTPDEAKTKLAKHLINSSNHNLGEAEAWEKIEDTTIEIGKVKEQEKWKAKEQGKKERDPMRTAKPKEKAEPPAAKGHKRPPEPSYPPPNVLALSLRKELAQKEDSITIKKEKLQIIIDSLTRASASAKASQKLAAAASESFGAEMTVLAEIKANFEALKNLM